MVNIDFHEQAAQQDISEKRGILSLLGGWQIALLLLLFTFTVYGVSYFYKKMIEGQIAKTQQIIEQEKSTINEDDIKQVINLNKRKDIIEKVNDQEESDAQVKLSMVERNLNEGVYLTKYSYSEKESQINLEAVAANYHTLAQQIYNFRNVDDVRFVKINNTSRNEDGGVIFDIALGVN